MSKIYDIFTEVVDRHGEYIEMAGDKTPVLIISILCQMVMKEREENEYLRRRLNSESGAGKQ
jgi:hypothetical protein